MIDYRSLTEINMSLEKFMKMTMEYNLRHGEFKPSSKYEYNGLYQYMDGLSKFGSMIFSSEYNLKIFKRQIKEGPYNRIIYYAIDPTGLSHGYIYGPITESLEDCKSFVARRDRYYGFYMQKCTYVYDCVLKMGATDYADSKPVDLDLLRQDFLPLQKGGNNNKITRYYNKDIKYDVKEFDSTIYRSDTRSFYLPFIELIRKHLELDGWTVRVTPTFEKDHIAFKAGYYWNTRKHDNWNEWTGQISYDTFDIIDIKLTEEGSEYNW